jgi:phospholipid/cholesterol/gamma-HCH transport system permease protein
MAVGSRVRGWLLGVGDMAILLFLAVRSVPELIGARFKVVAQVTIRQIYFTGNQALSLSGLIAFLIGAIVVLQATTRLSLIGAAGFVGDLMVIAVLRELGPLITAVIVISRSGTAMATELASMRLRGEVDELESMGIDPIQYLFIPRLIGAVVALFALIIYFDLMAVLGGCVALGLQTQTPLRVYLGSVLDAIMAKDLALIPAKAVLFGSLFAILSCHSGLRASISPTEIPKASTAAAVTSLIGIFVMDSALVAVIYA